MKRWMKVALGSAVAMIAFGLWFTYYIGLLDHNFRVIAPNKAYRSAQLPPALLEREVQEHSIKCVVNLRGDAETAAWHRDELAVCKKVGIEHADIHFDLRKLPEPEQRKELLKRFEEGPYPILLHCRAGSERTGLASLLYVMIVEGKPLQEALATQTGWQVGHFRTDANDAGDRFVEIYRKTGNGQNIKTWILEKYPAIYEQIGALGKAADVK